MAINSSSPANTFSCKSSLLARFFPVEVETPRVAQEDETSELGSRLLNKCVADLSEGDIWKILTLSAMPEKLRRSLFSSTISDTSIGGHSGGMPPSVFPSSF